MFYLIIYVRKLKNHLYLMRLLTINNIVLYIKLHHQLNTIKIHSYISNLFKYATFYIKPHSVHNLLFIYYLLFLVRGPRQRRNGMTNHPFKNWRPYCPPLSLIPV
ncbi:hypothetical protein LY90DRAFT_512995 [Neocallimastix californiae]|uniref:Uncharacterized protein n=1 Tax=Neocallimastix californiae TaxID=1754190 RepID=A0A1Y2B1X6_9FUNG|nr:hypothetical protein LY90DRAFT_512995 [Neocallimastix californiae]|eukprot:ORY28848.1 hypothetical protein LY90DRAFT_512995 [Neocallimastix californiae]